MIKARKPGLPGPIHLAGDLPSGEKFVASVDLDMIVVSVQDRICAAHPRWMSTDQAHALVTELQSVMA